MVLLLEFLVPESRWMWPSRSFQSIMMYFFWLHPSLCLTTRLSLALSGLSRTVLRRNRAKAKEKGCNKKAKAREVASNRVAKAKDDRTMRRRAKAKERARADDRDRLPIVALELLMVGQFVGASTALVVVNITRLLREVLVSMVSISAAISAAMNHMPCMIALFRGDYAAPLVLMYHCLFMVL